MAKILLVQNDPNDFGDDRTSSTSLSHNHCCYSPNFNLKLFDAIQIPRDLSFLPDLEPTRVAHILLKFSEENLTYAGDAPDSESRTVAHRYSSGHFRFIDELSESLWDTESDLMPESVVKARRLIEDAYYDCIERTFYETNVKKIGSIFYKLIRKKDIAKAAAYHVTGKKRLDFKEKDTPVGRFVIKLGKVWNYISFDRQLQQLLHDVNRLAIENDVDPFVLMQACQTMQKFSRSPMTLKTCIQTCCETHRLRDHSDILKKILDRYFGELLQTEE